MIWPLYTTGPYRQTTVRQKYYSTSEQKADCLVTLLCWFLLLPVGCHGDALTIDVVVVENLGALQFPTVVILLKICLVWHLFVWMDTFRDWWVSMGLSNFAPFVVASWLPWRCPNNWRRSSWEPWGSPISHSGHITKNLSGLRFVCLNGHLQRMMSQYGAL